MYNNNNNGNNNNMYRIPNRIFVGGIHQNASQDELRNYFSHFGAVKDARIITDPRGNSKGYGFVTYESENDASKVLSLKEEELIFKENKLNIGHAFKKKNNFVNNNFNYNGVGGHQGMSMNMNMGMGMANRGGAAGGMGNHVNHNNMNPAPTEHMGQSYNMDTQLGNMHHMGGVGMHHHGMNLAAMNGMGMGGMGMNF